MNLSGQEPQPGESCADCGQVIPDRCFSCNQFIPNHQSSTEQCQTCGQELPEDDSFKWKRKRNGKFIAVCSGCKRKIATCPVCEQDFKTDESSDSESTDEETTDESDNEEGDDEEEESNEEEDPEDNETEDDEASSE